MAADADGQTEEAKALVFAAILEPGAADLLASAVLAADEGCAVAGLGSLLLLAGGDEGRAEAFADALASPSPSYSSRS